MTTAPSTLKPGYLPPAGTIERLAARRRLRRLWNDIHDGKWSQALVDSQVTQHLFPSTERQGGRIGAMIEKANLARAAFMLHADIIANREPTISVPAGNTAQRAALDALRDRCLFGGMFHAAMLTVNIEAECAVAVDRTAPGDVTLCLEENDVALPVGPPDKGAGNQPSVWERRWIIERPHPTDKNKTLRFLRVERHAAPGGVGVIEHEAYTTQGDDVFVDLSTLERVPLATAIANPAAVPEERTETGLPFPLFVQLVGYRRRGQPEFRVSENDLDIFDQCMASLSQVARAMERHADPKLLVPESAIDSKTGKLPRSDVYTADPEAIKYLTLDAKFDWMLDFLDKALSWLMVALSVNPGLLGLEGKGASASDTASKLRLRSASTLASAERSVPHVRSALERLLTLASMLDSRRPTTGYPVAPVGVRVNPELPMAFSERVSEQAEAYERGMTSRRRALAEIHGEDRAEEILAEIEADEDAKAKRAALSVSASFGVPAAPNEPDDDERGKDPESPIPTGEAA